MRIKEQSSLLRPTYLSLKLIDFHTWETYTSALPFVTQEVFEPGRLFQTAIILCTPVTLTVEPPSIKITCAIAHFPSLYNTWMLVNIEMVTVVMEGGWWPTTCLPYINLEDNRKFTFRPKRTSNPWCMPKFWKNALEYTSFHLRSCLV